MFGSDPHAAFILASYAVTAVTLLALAVWIAVDYRSQKARLAEMEARGISRRSARGSSPS